VAVAVPVVQKRALAGGILDVLLLDRPGCCRLRREVEDPECAPGVTAGSHGDQLLDRGVEGDGELGRAPFDDLSQLLAVERLQLVHLQAGEQGRVELEVRVLGGRADQGQDSLLDSGEKRILLGLVEAMDLIEEEDRAPAGGSKPLAGSCQHLADVRHGRRDRRELLELGAGGAGHDPGERRLPRSGRTVEDE